MEKQEMSMRDIALEYLKQQLKEEKKHQQQKDQ